MAGVHREEGWRRFVYAAVTSIAVTTLSVAGGAAAGTAQAAPAAPTVTVVLQPSELGVGVGAMQPVVAIVTNAGPTAISDVTLKWRLGSGTGVAVRPENPPPFPAVAAGGSVSVDFVADRTVTAPKQAAPVLEVAYHDDATATDRVMATALTVKGAENQAAPGAVLTVDASSALADLQQYRSTDLKLTVTNSSALPRTITSVDVAAPSFVSLSYRGAAKLVGTDGRARLTPKDLAVAGGQQAVLLFHLEMDKQLEPGDAFVVFNVSSTDQLSQAATTVASTKLTFSVLGESAFLNVLGVPSVYLVPGLVFMVVLWTLRKRVYPKSSGVDGGAAAGLGIDAKAVFWVLGLLPSLLLPFIYPPVTQVVLHTRRDYRRAYGFDDILYVWILAAACAFAFWFVGWAVPALARLAWGRLFVPKPSDGPMRVLWKLARRGPFSSMLRLPARYTPPGGAPVPVRVLYARGGHDLVAGTIVYEPNQETIGKQVNEENPLRTALYISWYRGKHDVHVRYARGQVPVLVDAATVTVIGGRTALVEVAGAGE